MRPGSALVLLELAQIERSAAVELGLTPDDTDVIVADLAGKLLPARPGLQSCTECGDIDQPEYRHFTSEHTDVRSGGDLT